MPRRCAEPMQARLSFDGGRGGRGAGEAGVKRVRAEILSTRKLGAYHSLTLVAPEIAERARPGQFLAVKMPEGREFLLRRHFAIHQASRRGGWAGTLEFVVDRSGPGHRVARRRRKAHEFLDVIGPLGKAFAYPKRLTNCLLVAEGHGAASLYFLAQELLARHKRVDMVVGGETLERVFKPIEGKRLSQTIAIVTADGTPGRARLGDGRAARDGRAHAAPRWSTRPRRRPRLRAIAEFCRERQHPRAGRGRGADGLRVRAVPDVRRARRPQGRQRLRPPAVVRRRPGVQSGARAVGPVALGRARRCCPRRPRACRWCARGRGESDRREAIARSIWAGSSLPDAGDDRRRAAPAPAASSAASSTCARSARS